MFSRSICLTLVFGLLFSTALVTQAVAQDKEKNEQDVAWFDMDNCAICKNMASQKHDMHRIKWEVHMLDNGMLMVSVLPDDMKTAMAKAEEGVKKTVAEMAAGKQMHLCGFCQAYGGLMAMGVNIKELKTVGGDITIITSSDPEAVKKIQAFGKDSKIEHEKMLKQIKTLTSSK